MDFSKYKDNELLKFLNEKKPLSDFAFYELYSRFSTKIYNYCLFKVSIKENAEEIYQETWIRFSNAIRKNSNIDNVQAYLITIAKNLMIEFYRSKKNELNAETIKDVNWEDIICPDNFSLTLEKKEMIDLIKLSVNSLEDIYKEAFILNKFNDLSYSEIAELLGESVDCIKKRVYRATDMIKLILKPYIKELSIY